MLVLKTLTSCVTRTATRLEKDVATRVRPYAMSKQWTSITALKVANKNASVSPCTKILHMYIYQDGCATQTLSEELSPPMLQFLRDHPTTVHVDKISCILTNLLKFSTIDAFLYLRFT